MKNQSKKIMLCGIIIFALLVPELIMAQLQNLPQASPAVSITQAIGSSKVTIDYGSPRVRGRKIWGNLVPYGLKKLGFGNNKPAPWRAGANKNTVFTITHNAKINGKSLPAGSYGLHMIPGEKEWIIIFSKNYTSWGSFFYEDSEDALRVKVVPEETEFKEWLVYGFDKYTLKSAEAYLHWEKLKIPFLIEFDTNKITMQNIKNQLRSMAGFNWRGTYQAAINCLMTNSNLEQGLVWINKSISMNENANNVNMLGYLLMALNKKDQAMKVFKANIKKFPKNWNLYDSLAENLNKMGKRKASIKWFKIALKKAPKPQKNRIENILLKLKKK